MQMPTTVKQYIHRVGRTARAGKTGRSISLVGEEERKILKSILKLNKGKALTQRVVEPEVISAYKDRIDTLNPSVKKIEEEEKMEKSMRQAEKELEKTENKLKKGEDEREGRIWFQSKQAKQQEKKKLKVEFKKKLAEQEQKKKTPEQIRAEKESAFHAREAKRARKGKKIRAVVEYDTPGRSNMGRNSAKNSKKKKKSSFTSQLTNVGSKAIKRYRYGPDDAEFRQAKRAKMQQGEIRQQKRRK
uniref:Helicase C-terminal domain-containing protein n=1 Tax=Acrobeloides nanus TaxID=290746 RepID=A0A914D683_9BILA